VLVACDREQERVRREEPVARMLSSQQRLEPDHLALVETDHRLIVQPERAARDRVAQVRTALGGRTRIGVGVRAHGPRSASSDRT
jgi:hypothetical protein